MSDKNYISFAYDNPQEIGSYDFVPFIELTKKEKDRIKDGVSKDPDFHVDNASKKSKDSPDTNQKEALETLERCPICNFDFKIPQSKDFFQFNLCNYLDNNKQKDSKHFIYLHRRGEFEITFDVKKGNAKANDSDGYVEAMITPAYSGIEIISFKKVETSYNSQIKLKIKVKSDKEKDKDGNEILKKYDEELFQLNFFATDNTENWLDLEGSAKGSIHCGQFEIVSRNCICEDWANISTVIPEDQFVKYTDMGDCMKACIRQLEVAKFKPSIDGWGDGNSEFIYRIFEDKNSDKLNDLAAESYEGRFILGITYLKKALNDSTPIIVGLDYKDGSPKDQGDSTTDHFVVVVGMGKDSSGYFFRYFENAQSSNGTFQGYKLYCSCKDFTLKTINGAFQVTQIRESIKI